MKPSLLIADGDDYLSDIYTRYFSLHGYKVQTATGGVECATNLRRSTPDVLVLDMDLPWGGGEGVLAMMREDGIVPSTLTVLLASDASDDSPPAPNGSADVRCLRKPFDLRELLDCIREATMSRCFAS